MSEGGLGFNLLAEPCIPVVFEDGGGRRVSVREALARASELVGLSADPLAEVALLRRLLLPLAIEAFGQPQTAAEWTRLYRAGSFDADRLDSYLAEHGGRFDLFDPQAPFDQVGGLEATSGETKPVTLLIASAASGNNVPLFSARTEADAPSLTPPEALVALLCAQLFDTAAIKPGAVGDNTVKAGKTSGNPTGPVGQFGAVVPRGRNLFETIMLNTPIGTIREADAPWWRRAPASAAWEKRHARGLLDLLTFQSRRIRLIPESTVDGVVVRRVVLAAGDRLAETPDYEPHAQWRQVPKPKAGEPPQRPMRHQSGRAGWQGLQSLLALTWTAMPNGTVESTNLIRQMHGVLYDVLPNDLPLDLLLVGVEYGNMSAIVENVIADSVPLPIRALSKDETMRDAILNVVVQGERLREALNDMESEVRKAVGVSAMPWDKGQRSGDQLLQSFDVPIRELLTSLQENPHGLENASHRWERTASKLALAAADLVFASAPRSAFLGRVYKTKKDKKYRYNTTHAMGKFRKKVRELLPAATDKEMSAS